MDGPDSRSAEGPLDASGASHGASSHWSIDARAEQLYAAFSAARERGEPVGLESLCAQHPELADDLRVLEDVMAFAAEMRGALRSPAPEHRSVADRLQLLLGSDGDASVRPMVSPDDTLGWDAPRGTRYALLGEVARGGMGAIVRVWDDDLKRTLAMKVALRRSGETRRAEGATPHVDAHTLGRFLEEAQITGQLDHPGVIPVHELGIDSTGRLYFTMRLVRGEDLQAVFAHLRSGHEGWSEVRILNVLLRVCEAVAFAHSKGVIHRDLKPANVMVGSFGEVYVMDWGLARRLGRQDRHDLRLRTAGRSSARSPGIEDNRSAAEALDSPLMTMDGDIVGTPAFMPPEQARGELERLGPHSDVYSIGAMLYQLLTGTMPYAQESTNLSPRALLDAVLRGAPTAVEVLAPRTPPELVAICEKAMARQIEARYPTTQALASDLRSYLEGRVVAAYETGTWAETRKWVQRNKPLAASLGAVVLAVIAGAIGISVKAREARAALRVADENARRANQLAETEKRRADEVLRLSALRNYGVLVAEAEELWPVSSDRISDYEHWIARAQELVQELPALHRKRAELRTLAVPPTEQERALGLHEWHFPAGEEQASWWNDSLTTLITLLEGLLEPQTGLLSDDSTAVSEAHGWSVPRRLRLARTIADDSVLGPEASARWARASAAIEASPHYRGLRLTPQMGLLPLGPDPASGLWEFAHLQSGAAPSRGADGALVRDESTGIVLVLLPGGRFWMGSQSEDPDAPNYDPHAERSRGERPVHEVTLSAFFLSKYEMTRGQWLHATGVDPSHFQGGPLAPTRLHPVEQVSWHQCLEVLERSGLRLPTEAQWEYGARGGTETPWWVGPAREHLRGNVNLADRSASDADFDWETIDDWPDLDDGSAVHSEVGRYPANPFGLHEVAGNLWEWCSDARADYSAEPAVDPRAPDDASPFRIYRGGSFRRVAVDARSARRMQLTPEFRVFDLGLRPAKGLAP